eukprot:TRINITY_DN67229_c1_g2_i1.p1 TRINITY_DN67229_c1_g2~~TRINITY_DN67229_c1_g2_i1.p1  ORF type:complete len:1390 (+),score=148.98 TRINITY_DN67229_c1_g2_i1:25-4170(+)
MTAQLRVVDAVESPYDRANVFSRWLFTWLTPTFKLGRQRPITQDDIPQVPRKNTAKFVTGKFEAAWMDELAKKGGEASLLRAFMHTPTCKDFIYAIIFKCPQDILQFVAPYILSAMINYTKDTSTPYYWGWVYAALLWFVPIIQSLCLQRYFTLTYNVGMDVRAAVASLVYDKSLRLAHHERAKRTEGEMLNLMNVDTQRLADCFPYFHMVWSAPLQMIIAVVFLFRVMGLVAFVALAALALMVPLTRKVGQVQSAAQRKVMGAKDSRTKLINEMLQGFRVLKYYAWEEPFMQHVREARDNERSAMLRAAAMTSVNNAIGRANLYLVILVSFLVLVLTSGGTLDAATAFTAVSIINILRMPISVLPMVLSNIVTAKVSYDRLSKYMKADEFGRGELFATTMVIAEKTEGPKKKKWGWKKWLCVLCPPLWPLLCCSGNASKDRSVAPQLKPSVGERAPLLRKGPIKRHIDIQPNESAADEITHELRGASYSWENSADELALKDLTLRIPKGKLTSVVGVVGGGKSTFLQALFGDVPCVDGTMYSNRSLRVAYCSQLPWIRNASVKDNIVGNEPFDESRYRECLDVTGLTPDLALLPAGDGTEIGERGINLSGGQKARVALARAVYMDADIYLMDSPLSAVDAHVGKHLFEECIVGALAGKTRVLVTHALQFLPSSDSIIVMDRGRCVRQCSYEELTKVPEYEAVLAEHGTAEADKKALEESKEQDDPLSPSKPKEPAAAPTKDKPKNDKAGTLVQTEAKSEGGLNWAVYRKYLHSFKYWILCTSLLATVGAEVLRFFLDYTLNQFTNPTYHMSQATFFIRYAAFLVAMTVGLIFCTVSLRYGMLRAATVLHNQMLASVLRVPLSWFDQNPVGRILNRFTGDQFTIDMELPMSLYFIVQCFVSVASILLIVIGVTPWFAVAIIPLGCIYYYVQTYYRYSSREVARLNSMSRSPILHNFEETIAGAGLPTIRAHHQQQHFREKNQLKINNNLKPYWTFNQMNRWLGFRLEFLGSCVIGVAAVTAVISRNTLSPSLVGLSLSNILSFTNTFGWMVRQIVMAESQLTSVERIVEYGDLPAEAAPIVPGNRPARTWPETGRVNISEVCMRYREDLDLVLKSINMNVNPREKIGIVGRTGSGKSSLVSCLFRLVELASGKIVIDGMDIRNIGLTDLRSTISIIPQDPVLFSGNVRHNLDPFHKYSDEQIWNALHQAQMEEKIKAVGGLNAKVAEHGDNFSVGERQLICLARALVKQSRIVVLDEATANIDMDTDLMVQLCVRKYFGDSTVLTIAHRINTIIDSDKIAVLDDGVLAEYDSPKNLLDKQGSLFGQLVDQLGEKSAQTLRDIADGKQNYMDTIQKRADERAKARERKISSPIVRPSDPKNE